MKTARWMLAAGLVLMVAMVAPRAAAAGPAGFVAAVRGDARIVRNGDSLPARVGLEVRQGDRLVTGQKGRLKVLLTDDAVLALGSGSEVVLQSHMFGRHGGDQRGRCTRIELMGGTLRALVQKLVGGEKADFEVKSANAVAGVRGTEFVLVADGARTRLVTLSGEVTLEGDNGARVMVAAGEASRVEHGATEEPVAVAAAELGRLRRATDTDQSPTALAWNLRVGEDDRLGSHGPVPPDDTGDDGIDQELGDGGGQNDGCVDCGPDPRVEPCEDCIGELHDGPSAADGSFSSGDMPPGDVTGAPSLRPGTWMGDDIDLDPAEMMPVTLRIHVHRTHRP